MLGRVVTREDFRFVWGGEDHLVFAVAGSDVLLRYSTADASYSPAHDIEAELLRRLSPHVGVNLPTVLATVSETGSFLAALHNIPMQAVRDLVERDTFTLVDWQQEARVSAERLRDRLPTETWHMTTAFLNESLPDDFGRETFIHNDLGAEHLFVLDHTDLALSGVIDWSDAALGDPVADFAPLLRDCGPKEQHVVEPDDLGSVGAGDVGCLVVHAAEPQRQTQCAPSA